MPVVTVNIPEGKSDPLLKELLKEFAGVAKALRGQKPSQDASGDVLRMLARQQETLLSAMTRMMGMVGKMGSPNTAMLQGLKTAFSGMASELREAIKGSYKSSKPPVVRPQVTVKPEVKVNLNGMAREFAKTQADLLSGKKFRNRTFGSNY